MRRAMYLYPWDLEEEGVSTVVARLRDAGLDAVALATSYHAGKFLRPHAPQRKVYFPEDGTIYFRPDLSRYRTISPRVNSRVDEYDALRELERHAPDLARLGWTVGLHNTPLGLDHPDCCTRNAYGDPLYNSLCPSRPEVREYLVALCADLGDNQGLAEVMIETPGWQAFRHGHHHEFELLELTETVEILLGMCFCDACRAGASAAGIDADGLAANTRRELDMFFEAGEPPATDPRSDPDWQAFHAWRAGVVTALVAEVRAELNRAVELAVIPTVQTPNALCWIEGSDLRQLAATADRLEVPAYQRGLEAIGSDVTAVRAEAGADARLGFILRPTWPHLDGPADLRAAVRIVGNANAESIAFYNYGHMRLESLDWIRSALP
ncbi:MAG TPA: hypothetical protein GYA10_15615 [Alphaproteobacteria bacterium]|nr:hypothetical protein [Alphaproteobacteria bacterium]